MDIRSYLSCNSITSKDLADRIGVSKRTVDGWLAGRPVPAWVPVVLKKLDSTRTLWAEVEFLDKFNDRVRCELLRLRKLYDGADKNSPKRYTYACQIYSIYSLWQETYPVLEKDYHVLRTEFFDIVNSCRY